MIDLKSQVVIVTGGAGLLGEAIVRAAILHNAVVVIADRDKGMMQKVLAGLSGKPDYSAKTMLVETDITSSSSIQQLIVTVLNKYGRIDALINSAYPRNKNYGRHFYDVEYDDFCQNLSLHLGGSFLIAQKFGEYFSEHGGGNIINVASVYGVVAPRFELYEETGMTMPVEYAAIKSAIIHLTRYMAKYFKGKNIRVNSVSPGGILDNQPGSFIHNYKNECANTGMLTADDVARVFIFLLSDYSKYINGQNIIVDDGFVL